MRGVAEESPGFLRNPACSGSANGPDIASAERSSDSALLVKARNITDGEEVDAPMSVAVNC